jgi:uncharacterized membrane protein YeaQ/YmgE (transglycosylase-associated protein family)
MFPSPGAVPVVRPRRNVLGLDARDIALHSSGGPRDRTTAAPATRTPGTAAVGRTADFRARLVSVVSAILSVVFSGFVIGALARLAVPGPDPMPLWLTVLIGLGGSIVGGAVAAAIYGTREIFGSSTHVFVTVLLEIGAATVIVGLYRRYVQRRPLSGPAAYRFPTRGVGIERMRERLRRLGVDPDRLRRPDDEASQPLARTPEEIADELEKLRDLHTQGALSDEEYEQARATAPVLTPSGVDLDAKRLLRPDHACPAPQTVLTLRTASAPTSSARTA